MRKYSYESILRTVGRVLDEADAKSFAIRDSEDGLRVETFGQDGTHDLAVDLGLADLVELIDVTLRTEEPRYERSYSRDEGTLRHFLERHELVGAGR